MTLTLSNIPQLTEKEVDKLIDETTRFWHEDDYDPETGESLRRFHGRPAFGLPTNYCRSMIQVICEGDNEVLDEEGYMDWEYTPSGAHCYIAIAPSEEEVEQILSYIM